MAAPRPDRGLAQKLLPRALQIYRDEIHRNLALLGCNISADIGPQCLLFADQHELRPPQEKPSLRVVEGKAAESSAGSGFTQRPAPHLRRPGTRPYTSAR
ncbi:MAG: hypothetical protein H6R21_1578 [Proteobacteria bacterium]|nr:hypothetical protein [Pseudomonadota bacterium]